MDKIATYSMQPCPLCGTDMSHRSMPGLGEFHWHCEGCKTEWPVGDLIDAINEDEVEED